MKAKRPKLVPKPTAPDNAEPPGLHNYSNPNTAPRNALAQRLAAEYKSKQMLTQDPNARFPLSDEIGGRPAPMFSLSRFNPSILGGDRKNYENWRYNATVPRVKFGNTALPVANRA